MKVICTLTRSPLPVLLIVTFLSLVLAFPAMTQGPENYTLEWWTVDGGGGVGQDTTSPYILGGTIGQPDAGILGNGEYTLIGGFWVGGRVGHRIYLPLVLRNY
jgi:hypothetical protein